ncbi:MAG: hypothetical protein Q7R47_05150 [Candidatus Diapherotrites archaeon]|nr:hypothetical protein [Candidatus Diapherotrites archaeon]
MKRTFIAYWILAVLTALVFGEILPGIASQNGVFFQHPIPITIYYVVLCFLFAHLVHHVRLLHSEIVFFFYGALVEMLVFGNVHGPFDILGIVFFGLLYVFLFGAPWLITQKIVKTDSAEITPSKNG